MIDALVDRALADARTAAPYYARGLAALTPISREGLGTCGVDTSWRLYFDPAFLASQTRQECAAVILHELSHLLRTHARRATHIGAQHHSWNVAADAEINDDIAGLPADAVYPATLGQPEGLTAEDYYRALPIIDRPSCGSGSGGEALPGELAPDADAPGVDDSPGSDGDRLRDQVAADVRIHASRGTVPAAIRLWSDLRLTPVPAVPRWQDVIPAWMGQRGHDWAWGRLSRRIIPGVVRPGMSRQHAEIGIVVDVSGSMSGIGSEVLSVLHSLSRRADVWLYPHDCDDTVARARRYHRPADVMALTGGGGTDLRPAISAALRCHKKIMVITDGDTPWPSPWPTQMLALIIRDGQIDARHE